MSTYALEKVQREDAERAFSKFAAKMHGWGRELHVYKSGSSVICDPPVLNTDIDYLVYVNHLDSASAFLTSNGWTNCLDEWLGTKEVKDNDDYAAELESGARFAAFRKHHINVIVTDDKPLHLQSIAATMLAKELNLLDKGDRIALFRAVKFGEQNYKGPMP